MTDKCAATESSDDSISFEKFLVKKDQPKIRIKPFNRKDLKLDYDSNGRLITKLRGERSNERKRKAEDDDLSVELDAKKMRFDSKMSNHFVHVAKKQNFEPIEFTPLSLYAEIDVDESDELDLCIKYERLFNQLHQLNLDKMLINANSQSEFEKLFFNNFKSMLNKTREQRNECDDDNDGDDESSGSGDS